MKVVIGIGGQKRAGKDTLAEFITRTAAVRGMKTEKVSFAEPIKRMLREVFIHEVPYSTFTADDRKTDKVEIAPGVYMTVRELLQQVGTDCFRNIIHKDFWVNRGIGKIKSSTANIVLIPDVRFANELVPLKEMGYTIYVEKLTDEILPVDTHPSEMELESIKSEFDYLVQAPKGAVDILEDWAKAFVAGL